MEWTQVSAGYGHTVAIKSDGTLWAWGRNNYGQLGDNTTTSRYVPTQENTNGTTWTDVSEGADHRAAIKNDGTLWAWGHNGYGQLGDDTTTDRHVPTQEYTNGTTWIQVSAGYFHTVAIQSDANDTLWAWGSQGNGQLATDRVFPERTIRRK
jgi:alpha-tubulin suppressor-like RCC1 family protein